MCLGKNKPLPLSLRESSLFKEAPLPTYTSQQINTAITKILLFGDNKVDFETKKILLMSAVAFI